MNAIQPCNLRAVSLCAAFAAIQLLGACAVTRTVDHSFSFDAFRDSPGITILDFRYGSSGLAGTSNIEPGWTKKGESPQRTGTTQPMPAGPDLYVRWRIDATKEVFERTVDLRTKLARNIDGHTVYFVVRGSELYVYLVTPEPRDPKAAPIGPDKYSDKKVILLYPDR